MFDHIFENRDKKVTNLIKLSDYLGRALRENVEIFSIDDSKNSVTLVTENGKIIVGNYDFSSKITLNNIQIEDEELFENTEKFDSFVDYKISNFIQNIYEEDFSEADTSFSKILDLWDNRVKFSSVKSKLYEKSQKFNGSNRIIQTDEFQKLVEFAPQLATFLKENASLVEIPEIKNMVKLSATVSTAFDLPKIKIDELRDASYTIPEEVDQDIYEMICKHELVRKELVESKNNFDLVWLNNDKISKLASLIYESDEQKVIKHLVEAVCDVPYLALATKKQITQTLLNNLELNESVEVKVKDIKAFSSLLFEYKKPIKKLFMSMLNEKYGISVQNLKDIPTFKSLLNTQVLIFESLSKLSPKSSIQKDLLSETAKMIKGKNGVECIDVNDFLQILFEQAGYYHNEEEEPIAEEINLTETISDIGSMEDLVTIIQEMNISSGVTAFFCDPNKVSDSEEEEEEKEEEDPVVEDSEEGYEKKHIVGGTDEAQAEEDRLKKKKKRRKKRADDETEVEEEPRVDEDDMDGGEAIAVKEKPKEKTKKKEKEEPEDSENDIMSSFKKFEDILDSIDFEGMKEFEDTEEEEEDEEEEAEEAKGSDKSKKEGEPEE